MLRSACQNYILRQVNQNKLPFPDLRNEINVSDDVIKKNLHQSSNDRKIKVHENALSLSFQVRHYSTKKYLQAYTKRVMAHKAVSHIRNGMFILTTKGATISRLGRSR